MRATLLAERVRDAAPAATFGFLLLKRDDTFYRNFAAHLQQATRASRAVRGRAVIEFLDDLSPATLVADHARSRRPASTRSPSSRSTIPCVSEAIATLRGAGRRRPSPC